MEIYWKSGLSFAGSPKNIFFGENYEWNRPIFRTPRLCKTKSIRPAKRTSILAPATFQNQRDHFFVFLALSPKDADRKESAFVGSSTSPAHQQDTDHRQITEIGHPPDSKDEQPFNWPAAIRRANLLSELLSLATGWMLPADFSFSI